MSTWVSIIILALATWRVASLLANEDGPIGVFAKLRAALGEEYDEFSNAYVKARGSRWYHGVVQEIGNQLTCLWCCTIWVGVAWTVLYFVAPNISTWLALPFALSGVAVYLNARARFRK